MGEKPHILTAKIDPQGWGGVEWHLECPYEGVRDCGILVACTDPAHAGPGPSPDEPDSYPLSDAWQKWQEAYDEWREVCPSDGHPGEQCWFAYMINNREDEPEYWLAEMPTMTISGPIEVAVSSTGYDEDIQMILKPWTPEEKTND